VLGVLGSGVLERACICRSAERGWAGACIYDYLNGSGNCSDGAERAECKESLMDGIE
jgi:hypothetical protein